jgi:flagellar hook-associated protein 2
MAGTISMVGLSSDIDWTKIITDTIDSQKTLALSPYNNRKSEYEAKLSAWQSFNTYLSNITGRIEADKFAGDDGYQLYSTTLYSSNSSIVPANVMNISLGSVNGPANYSFEVTALAKAEKIASDAFTSYDTALGFSGDIVVNGKAVAIEATDTLMNVASRINDAGAGATASVLLVSDTEYRLVLQSDTEGTDGMSLKNGSGSDLLESLNLHTGTEQLAYASGPDALSDLYTSKTSEVGTLLGLSSPRSGTIRIRGTDDVWKDVAIDLGTDTLEEIVAAINTAAPTGVAASVEEATDDGAALYRLKLTNVDISDLEDANNILETAGILEGTRKNTVQAGQNASLTIDGMFTVSSATNTVTGVIEGVTLNLVGTNEGSPIELRITQDNAQIAQKFSLLANDINTALNFIKDQNTYVEGTDKALKGDINLSLVRNNIASAIYTEASGNIRYKTPSDLGVSFQSDGTISVNTTTLANAMSSNRSEAMSVLKAMSDALFDALDLYVDPYTGTLTSTKTSIQDNITRIDAKIAEIEERFERQRAVLEKRYAALEVLISSSNMTKNWLTQQINYMTKMSSGS